MKTLTREERRHREASEDDTAQAVEDLLDLYKVTWCHFRPGQTKHGWRTPLKGRKGVPDYICAKNGKVLLIETKRELGKLSEDQSWWGRELGEHFLVVKPSDLDWFAGWIKAWAS